VLEPQRNAGYVALRSAKDACDEPMCPPEIWCCRDFLLSECSLGNVWPQAVSPDAPHRASGRRPTKRPVPGATKGARQERTALGVC
jgi:hypothetical protein